MTSTKRKRRPAAVANLSIDPADSAEAAGLIYEITYLRPGLPAPAINTKARNGRTFDLAALRGKPAVLVFWGTT